MAPAAATDACDHRLDRAVEHGKGLHNVIEVDDAEGRGGAGTSGPAGEVFTGPPGRTERPRRGSKGPSCETCYFGCRDLCALDLGAPCATFRPNDPDGLRPPRQPPLLVRDSEVTLAA